MSFPLIPYTNAIPAAANNPSNDQPDMQANTDAIDTLLDRDHYSFNENFSGLHKQSRYPVQARPATDAGMVALYAKTGAVSSELFMVRDNNIGTEVALTTSKIGAPTVGVNGVSWLPGGILIQWGRSTQSTNGAVTFPAAFPNQVFSVTVSILENNNNRHFIQVKTIATNQFTVASRDSGGNDESNTFSWMAIGN
jgi:hypothetical protein